MVKPIVLADVDMVLGDYVKRFVEDSRKLLKKPGRGYVQTHYYFTECGWSEQEEKQIQAKQKGQYNFWRQIEKMPNTGDLKRRYKDLSLFFVTARFSTDGAPMIYQTADWLEAQYGIRDAYVIAATKKGPVAADIDAEYAIDDKPQNCVEILQAVPTCKVFLQDASYNKDFFDSRIERVAHFNAFLEKIKT